MTTLLEIVKKLPSDLVVGRPRLQLIVAWANILLQRPAPAAIALDHFQAALARADLNEATRADLRAEADVVRAVAEAFADRSRPWIISWPKHVTTGHFPSLGSRGRRKWRGVRRIYRFDFVAVAVARRAAPYQETMGPFATVYGRCSAGIAARYQLDIPAARKISAKRTRSPPGRTPLTRRAARRCASRRIALRNWRICRGHAPAGRKQPAEVRLGHGGLSDRPVCDRR